MTQGNHDYLSDKTLLNDTIDINISGETNLVFETSYNISMETSTDNSSCGSSRSTSITEIDGKSNEHLETTCIILPAGTNDSSCLTEHEDSVPHNSNADNIGEYNGSYSGEDMPNLKNHIGVRSLIAFWLLGLCNNYGYVVMLSAAHDIISRGENTTKPSNPRDCNTLTTGAILLADIIPSLLIKISAPFFPLCIHFRLFLVVVLSISGYILVAISVARWMAIAGVVATALSSGLGEASILSYMAFYKDKNVISTWSSGTGGAGFFGSFSYAFLISVGLTPATTLYCLSSIPILMGITFWVILKHPELNNAALIGNREVKRNSKDYYSDVPLETSKDSFIEKLTYIPQLFKYMIPIGLVYLFEYFINQGLLELVYFPKSWITHSGQYMWYQVLYQIGVFISRSSIRLIQIKHLWLLAVLQFINVIFFVFQSIYTIIPSIYVVMAIVLWEGLLGGASYVNTFHKISTEIPPAKREFSMSITSFADALGITMAGVFAFPTHNYICQLSF